MTNKNKITLLLISLWGSTAYASDSYFPPELLGSDSGAIADLSRFNADGSQLPGAYQVDFYLNNTFIANRLIRFDALDLSSDTLASHRDDTGLTPCLLLKDLKTAGVKVELHPEMMALNEDECISPAKYIPGALSSFDFQKMRLDISVPQASVRNTPRGDIDPELWDEGINAALMNYSFSGNRSFSDDYGSTNYFLSLNGGVNVGPWRFRDFRTWNFNKNRYTSEQNWQRIKTYAERTIIPLRSNLVLGESTTDSNVFDSVGFRGFQLSTDDNMLPDTMRGFAPAIRGVADSNAEVSVRQNGYTIYKTMVPPGAFEITDLNPLSSSGDLNVIVTEAGGKVREFTVPYSSVPSLLREDRVKYALTAGKFNGSSSRYEDPAFAQGTLMWGLPHDVTLYGGMQYSRDYLATQTGLGLNMGRLGAISADITHAKSTLIDGSEHQGQSLRFLYAHVLNPTGTRFRLTGYRYSTKGFRTLEETALKTMSGRLYDHSNAVDEDGYPVSDTYSDYYNLYESKKSRFEANISQSLADYGSVWLTGVRQTYWNTKTSNDSLQLGYSNSIGAVNYMVNYGYTRRKNADAPSYTDRTIGLSLSVPFDKLFSATPGHSSVYATFNANRDNHGNMSQQAGLSGTLLEDKNLNWYASQGYSRNQGTSGNASLDYKGGYGNAGLGYSHSGDSQRVNYNVSGGALLHRGGLTLGQPLGENAVLVATQGVSDIRLQNEPGVKTDWRGFAIKPYTSAYRENRVAIDGNTLDDRTEAVDGGVMKVVPTKGAIVRTDFNIRQGQRVLMTLTHNGKPLPFGSVVNAGDTSSLVGDYGQVFLSGMSDKGKISASWGKDTSQQCSADYKLTPNPTTPVARIQVNCI